jgi:AraC-like DNA-binding protein
MPNKAFRRARGQNSGARRLLRETGKAVVEIAIDLVCTNPSHFACLFRGQSDLFQRL